MIAVIKSDQAGARIAPLQFGPAPDTPQLASPPDPALARLETECEDLQTALAKAREDLETASGQVDVAFERGRETGRDEAERRQDERLAILSEAVERATASFAGRLTELDRLAPLLARACLDKLFADETPRTDLVERLLAAQLEQIEAQAVISIRVSAEDFSSTDALAEITANHSGKRLDVRADPALASGECNIALELGGIEIGLAQQWGRLAALLDEMAEPRAER